MAAGVRNIKIKFTGDTSGLGRTAADGEKQLGKFQRGFGNVNRAALRVSTGVAVAAGAWVKSTATALGRIEKISAQTDSVIRSMDVKWTNTAEIEAYAAKLEKLTGVEGELIQEGQNLLLTFGKIQNKAGAGNLIFDRATTAINDMSVALGQDMKSSAIQVGKALNDPIKGVTALQRVGVSFTAAQKKQITALTESGDVLGAQRIILAELEQQFGGSAVAFGETMPGQIEKMKNAFGEVSEKLLVSLMPAFKNLLAIGLQVADWMMANQGSMKALGLTLVGLAGFVFAANGAFRVWVAITRTLTAVQWLLNTAMKANPIGRVIMAISALVAAITYAWNKHEGFRKVVLAVWGAIKTAAVFVWRVIVSVIRTHVNIIMAVINYIRAVPGKISDWFGRAKEAAVTKLSALVAWVKGLPGRILGALGRLGSLLYNAGRDILTGLWNGIKSMGSFIKNKITGFISSIIPGPVKSILGIASPSKMFFGFGVNIGEGLTLGIDSQATAVEKASKRLAKSAVSPMQKAKAEMLRHLKRGGKMFEDFSYRGNSPLVRKYSDKIADQHYDSGGKFNKSSMERFLKKDAKPSGGDTYNVTVKAHSDRFSLRQVQRELAMHAGL